MGDLRKRIRDLEQRADDLKRCAADFRRRIEDLERKAAECALLAQLAMNSNSDARSQTLQVSDELLVLVQWTSRPHRGLRPH